MLKLNYEQNKIRKKIIELLVALAIVFAILTLIYFLSFIFIQHKSPPPELYNSTYGVKVKLDSVDISTQVNMFDFIEKKTRTQNKLYQNIWHIYIDPETIRFVPFDNYNDAKQFIIEINKEFPNIIMNVDVKK